MKKGRFLKRQDAKSAKEKAKLSKKNRWLECLMESHSSLLPSSPFPFATTASLRFDQIQKLSCLSLALLANLAFKNLPFLRYPSATWHFRKTAFLSFAFHRSSTIDHLPSQLFALFLAPFFG
jgi:hypothetical protein